MLPLMVGIFWDESYDIFRYGCSLANLKPLPAKLTPAKLTPAVSSAAQVHPTAIVDDSVQLGDGVVIGPYCVIGHGVVLGENTELQSHVIIESNTTMGKRNHVYSHASIGQPPQDKKHCREDEAFLEIGDDNVFREFVTLNRGSPEHGGRTKIGNRNWIMAYCHVAHNCVLGNDITMANGTTLAGHVRIEDGVYAGGFTMVHQFCVIGKLVMAGVATVLTQDVAPYVLVVGNRARLYGLNRLGLERAGFSDQQVRIMQEVYKMFFNKNLKADEALLQIGKKFGDDPHAKHFINFVRSSERGICR